MQEEQRPETAVKLDEYFTYKPSSDGTRITVRTDKRAKDPVPERLFGLFTEHLGKNVYGGAWAQALPNGGFEPFDAVLEDVPESHRKDVFGATKRRLEVAAAQFRMPDLPRCGELETAPYWAPIAVPHGATTLAAGKPFDDASVPVSYSLVPGLNGHAQRVTLSGEGAPTVRVGVETPVYLPLHRTGSYDFQVRVRVDRSSQSGGAASGPRTLHVQVWQVQGQEIAGTVDADPASFGLDQGGVPGGDEPDRLLGEEAVRLDLPTVAADGWSLVRTVLHLDTAGVPKGSRLKLRLLLDPSDGPGNVAFDQALLFPTDAIEGWDPDVVRLLRQMRLSLLRFPGGNFASGYHWQDGVGPVERRPEKPNPAWPEWEPNHVGTDEWLTLCELVGAEPLICVNAGNGTPEEAANWIRYCNDPETTEWGRMRAANGHPAPYNVRLWEIGNELWGTFQIGWTGSDEYGERFGRFAAAMKEADPTIQLIAIGGSMPSVLPADEKERNPGFLGAAYAEKALKNHGKDVWAIAEHAVMGGRLRDAGAKDAYMALLAHTHHVGRLLEENRRKIKELASDALVSQTEQMVAVRGEDRPSDNSLAAAIVWSGFMNWFIRSEGLVPLFTRSAMINHGDLLEKVREVVYPLPGYHGQAMYARQPGRIPVGLQVETPVLKADGKHFMEAEMPAVDAVGLMSPNGDKVVVIATNRDPEKTLETTIAFEGMRVGAEIEVTADFELLAGPSCNSRNYWYAPGHVKPVRRPIAAKKEEGKAFHVALPPHSIAVFAFNASAG